MPARVLVLSLGGTIAMSEHGTGAVLDLDAASLVDAVPELRRHADLTARSFRHLPGAHLRLEDIRALAKEICMAVRAGEFTGVVVTQGTDTIEETSFALDLLVRIEASVVVTGAMRNASQPGADGPANLLDAVCVASDPAAHGLGTVVVLNGEIHAARFVYKAHSFRPDAFVSLVGPLGWISERRAHVMLRPPPVTLHLPEDSPHRASRVAILTVALGDDGALISEVQRLGYDALVVDALGAGHVSSELVGPLEDLARHMPVVLCSRTGGPVLTATYGFSGSERDLLGRGLISGGYLGAPKARILLMLLLDRHADREAVQGAFHEFTDGGTSGAAA
jgi:L-asparaginase